MRSGIEGKRTLKREKSCNHHLLMIKYDKLRGETMWLFKKKKKRFGEILIKRGLATKEDIEEALKIQREIKEKKQIQKNIGTILHEKGVIDLEDIKNVLDEQREGESFFLKSLVYSIFHSK
ncbi:MAG: hypothetical protein Q8N91_07435 [Candidatus Omnitrophota bacterium]|nr:hypothetical protein [Candidatus Omnitrophota bacterium]